MGSACLPVGGTILESGSSHAPEVLPCRSCGFWVSQVPSSLRSSLPWARRCTSGWFPSRGRCWPCWLGQTAGILRAVLPVRHAGLRLGDPGAGAGPVGGPAGHLGAVRRVPAFADLVDELKADLLDETGIDFDTELMPWIGPEISAALLGFDAERQEPVAVAVIGVRDENAAAAFLAKWREYMAEQSSIEFGAGSHRGFDTWVADYAR